MIKDIKYSGYSAVPSDYECQDGQQSGMLNLIPEEGSLRPLFPPKPILDCNLGGVVKLIHHVPNQDNYIIVRARDDKQELYWLRKTGVYSNENAATYIATYSGIKDTSVIGNTVALATEDGLRYILWKEGSYITLASKPPFVSISFGMVQAGTCSDSADLNIKFARGDEILQTEENKNAILGFLLSSVKNNITNRGFFYMPFFVRYAYRLYDGTYTRQSAPILMLPNVIPPFIKVGEKTATDTDHVYSVKSTLDIPYFYLAYKILDDGAAEELKNWKDLVAGIDIFISAPIYTYNQSGMIGSRITTSDAILLYSYYDWNPNGYDIRLRPDIIPDKIFVGHYSPGGKDELFTDHFLSTDTASSFRCWGLARNYGFHQAIEDVNLFYHFSGFDIDSLTATEEYCRLYGHSTDGDSLVAGQTLPDDYQSHCELSANYLLTFNSRLNLADVHLIPAKPFPLKSAVQATTPTNAAKNITITVYSRLNGILCKATNELVTDSTTWDLAENFPRYLYYPDAEAYKMSLKCDDTEVIIDLTPHDFLNGAYWYGFLGPNAKPTTNAAPETRSTLTSVPMGNKIYTSEVNNPFSFPINGINTVGTGSIIGISTAAKALSQGQFGQFPLYAFTTEGVWALEVGSNGFYVARQPITRDVCTNAKGITQVDSAVLFPSSRGVMLLSGSNSVCISESIGTETPFALSELPSMSTIAKLAGCTSNQYKYAPFGSFLKTCQMIYDYLHQRIIICGDSSCAYVYSLRSKEWGMMANFVKSTIDSYPDALAMSQDGKLVDFSQKYVGWTYSLESHFPMTPEIQLDTKLDELTGWSAVDTLDQPQLLRAIQNVQTQNKPQTVNHAEMRSKGFFVTRPLKLDAPDILKTVDAIIQRGHFHKGHVQAIIYGSRDLYNWHLVWSSKDHYLRGFRGTPYKYFRIACVTSLSEDECIYGATIQFTPRLTNQPR